MVDQEEIHRKCNSDDPKGRREAVDQLRNRFEYLSEKKQMWQDLVRLTSDEDSVVRWKAARILGTVFQYVPDKEKAWEDLRRLTLDKDNDMRLEAAGVLDTCFQYVPDKEKAWEDLHRLTSDKDRYVRRKAARALGTNFQYMPDKEQAWQDLIKVASDKDGYTRREAVRALDIGFQYVPDKEKAWDDLVRLTLDKDSNVEWVPAWALGTVFRYVPDKEKAWEDLHRLTSDKDRYLRRDVAEALGTVIQYVPDKEKAWEDLHRLTSDRDIDVRQGATRALGTVFQYVPDKEKAWEDLHRLTSDQDRYVRRKVARALGASFQYVPDKEKAWEDLHRLTLDKDSYARNNAYHSLGIISIYKASQSGSEESYLEELKKAIEFFEKPAKEPTGDNSSRFCFPFYRSFYTIISAKKQKAENEVVKYLSEAKNAIDGSENKKLLFETVENLANALKEVHNLENMDLEAKKGELNFYRKYCEQAAELMKNTEESAPSATLLLRKGLPILDRKLKSLLKEIQEKAKTACREAKGTDTEEIACAVSREVQKWEIGSQEEMGWYVENLIFTLESNIPRIPKNQHVFDRISQIREERDVIKQYSIVCTIIPMIPQLSMDERIGNLEAKVDAIYEGIKELVICTKPGISEEIVITTGFQFAGSGAQHIITIPLQDISYFELKEDVGKIRGKTIDKLSKLPDRLAKKVKGYLLLNDKEDVLEQLS